MELKVIAIVFSLCLLVQVMGLEFDHSDKAQVRRHINVQRRLDKRLENLHERIHNLDEKHPARARENHDPSVQRQQARRHRNTRARLSKRADNFLRREELRGMRE